jgi:hypothetical protein
MYDYKTVQDPYLGIVQTSPPIRPYCHTLMGIQISDRLGNLCTEELRAAAKLFSVSLAVIGVPERIEYKLDYVFLCIYIVLSIIVLCLIIVTSTCSGSIL